MPTSHSKKSKFCIDDLEADRNHKQKLCIRSWREECHPASLLRVNSTLKEFTPKLRGNHEVRQTFYPWEMDSNTSKGKAPEKSVLRTGAEKLQKHSHI